MRDLNEFYFFHAVVTHKGFSAAERATGIPKGTLSKAVIRLEDRLKVRLLERTTRKLGVTELGRAFFEQCEVMLSGVDAAEAAAAQAQAEPYGLVRVGCPQGLIQFLMADILAQFMIEYPKVRVQVKVINRRADFVDDGIDVALRVRTVPDHDSSMIVRTLGISRLVLAMSPRLQQECGEITCVSQLSDYPTLSMSEVSDEDQWELVGPEDEKRTVMHRPRLLCSNFDMLNSAAIKGVGVALLPEHVTRSSFASGDLIHVLPGWGSAIGTVQAAFPTKRGLLPALRALIDHLVVEVPRMSSPASHP